MMNKHLFISCLVLILAAVSVGANGRGRREGMAEQGRNSKEQRLEQMRQQATEYARNIDQALKPLLEKVNENQRPDDDLINAAVDTLESAKRYGKVFELKDRAKFMLLQAWVYYFQDNVPQSLNWSMRSCRTYEPAKDGWATQALFSLLNDKQPMKPRPSRPQRQKRRPTRMNEMADIMPTQTMTAMSEPGVLDFDITHLQDQYLKQRFTRLALRTVSGQTIEYTPGTDTLCILFRQDQTTPADANDLQLRQTNAMQEFGEMTMMLTTSPGTQQVDIKSQSRYFEMLANACKDNENIKFVQIDLTKAPSETSPSADAKVPTILAAMEGSGASAFAAVDAQQPFMMITDSEGKTKYAGSAVGFIPAFILTELTGVKIDLQEQRQIHPIEQLPVEMMTDPRMMEFYMGMHPGQGDPVAPKPMADPNKPADPNVPAGNLSRHGQIPNYPLPNPKPAASLASLEWIKGTPVQFERGRIYVVEFWDTLGSACIDSIPYLTQMQNKYKDKGVTVIGVTSESKILGLQDSDDVNKFVAEQGSKMDYTVAVDKEKKAFVTYMQAYNQVFIPIAFVVDKSGLVVWYGDPDETLDMVLEKEVARKFDAEKAQTIKQTTTDFPTQALEDQVRAEKLLQSAQMHIEESRKLTMKNPKQGIKDARRVIAEYPNTEYAVKARELLRRVPERWKKRHNITNEELGY